MYMIAKVLVGEKCQKFLASKISHYTVLSGDCFIRVYLRICSYCTLFLKAAKISVLLIFLHYALRYYSSHL